MSQPIRSVLAILAGLAVAVVLVALIEGAGHVLFPLPEGLDPHDAESIRTMMDRIPLPAIAAVLLAWTVATFAGGWVAARLAKRSPLAHSFGVFLPLLLTSIGTMMVIPHPAWMWIGVLTLLPAAMIAAARLAGSRGPVDGRCGVERDTNRNDSTRP